MIILYFFILTWFRSWIFSRFLCAYFFITTLFLFFNTSMNLFLKTIYHLLLAFSKFLFSVLCISKNILKILQNNLSHNHALARINQIGRSWFLSSHQAWGKTDSHILRIHFIKLLIHNHVLIEESRDIHQRKIIYFRYRFHNIFNMFFLIFYALVMH